MIFEWDLDKAAANVRKHGVDFEIAAEVFRDEFALDVFDDRHSDSSEDRFKVLGLTVKGVLLVVYTVRDEERYRLISARKATNTESKTYWDERKKYE